MPGWYPAPVGDARGVVEHGVGGAVRGVLRLLQLRRVGAVVRPRRRERGGHVELVFQRLAELDHVAVELREVLDPAGRLPLVDVAVDGQRAEHRRGQRRDRDDGGQPPPDAPVDQGEPGPGRARPLRVRWPGPCWPAAGRPARPPVTEPQETRRQPRLLPALGSLARARTRGMSTAATMDSSAGRRPARPARACQDHHLRRPLPAVPNLPRRLALRDGPGRASLAGIRPRSSRTTFAPRIGKPGQDACRATTAEAGQHTHPSGRGGRRPHSRVKNG